MYSVFAISLERLLFISLRKPLTMFWIRFMIGAIWILSIIIGILNVFLGHPPVPQSSGIYCVIDFHDLYLSTSVSLVCLLLPFFLSLAGIIASYASIYNIMRKIKQRTATHNKAGVQVGGNVGGGEPACCSAHQQHHNHHTTFAPKYDISIFKSNLNNNSCINEAAVEAAAGSAPTSQTHTNNINNNDITSVTSSYTSQSNHYHNRAKQPQLTQVELISRMEGVLLRRTLLITSIFLLSWAPITFLRLHGLLTRQDVE